MSILDGYQSVTVDEFSGSKPLIDVADITPGDAQIALNCKFVPGSVLTREGFTIPWSPQDNLYQSSLFYWKQGQGTSQIPYLVRCEASSGSPTLFTVTLRNLLTGSEYTLIPAVTGTGVRYVPSGQRLYAAAIKSYVIGVGSGYVWDGNTAHQMDATFQRPMLTTEVTLALTQPNAGIMTAGVHYVGVLFQTRDGYWTRPGPSNSSLVLQPQNITSDGTHTITVTVTPTGTWPAWIKAIQVIATTTLNNFQYYVIPGTITAVTAGGAAAAVIDINVQDLQLRSVGSQGAGTLADDYFGLLSMDSSNNPPFSVINVLEWGNRIVWFGNYGGVDSFFPSDPLNFEWISADQHIQQLPGGLAIGAAFVLHGILYVISSSGGMWGYRDNGGRPVTFQPPAKIDGTISASNPFTVTVSSSGSYAVIGADQGVFVYSGGMFPQLPISYYQSPDIDGFQVQSIVDLVQHQTIYVQFFNLSSGVVLGAWNYQAGLTPDRVRYSKWTFSSSLLGSESGCMVIVLNPLPMVPVWELWLSGGGVIAGIWRQRSLAAGDPLAVLYADENTSGNPFGIDWQYQNSLLPHGGDGQYYQHIACRLRAKALNTTGSLAVTVKNLDNTATVTPAASPVALTRTPGQDFLLVYDMQSESASYLFTNSVTTQNGIQISKFSHFSTLIAEHR